MRHIIQGRRGFTLMELLTVMVIMSILLATGVVSYVNARRGAELRGAASTLQSVLSMTRQHAVTKRRTTAIVFRKEGSGTTYTNSYYVFEKIGTAGKSDAKYLYLTPLPPSSVNKEYVVCNMGSPTEEVGKLGTLAPIGANSEYVETIWLESGGKWTAGDWVGSQANEKMYLPPGVDCELDFGSGGNGLILFYANGKALGMDPRKITLTDNMSGGTAKRILTVYPLVGLVKVESK